MLQILRFLIAVSVPFSLSAQDDAATAFGARGNERQRDEQEGGSPKICFRAVEAKTPSDGHAHSHNQAANYPPLP